MRYAAFHHLEGYECFPCASDGKKLIIPFKTLLQDKDKEKLPYVTNSHKNITFLILSILEEENVPDRHRYEKFPFEFSFLFHPVYKNNGYNYVGPITFIPGRRNTMYFMAVLGKKVDTPSKIPLIQKINIFLFVVNPPTVNLNKFKKKGYKFIANKPKSEYFNKLIEIEDNDEFEEIFKTCEPTKIYKYDDTAEVKKIIFMSDDRHFLVITETKVLMYNIEDETVFEPKIIFPANIKILNCDYRNDTLLVLVESQIIANKKIQEVMFFNLQDRQIFRLDETCTPSYSIYIKSQLIPRKYNGLNIIDNDKDESEEKKSKYIHNTSYTDYSFIIYGCKFLPYDNNYISIILYEEDSRNLYIYFFKLNIVNPMEVYDIYKINSICLIQEEEIYRDIQKCFHYEIDKDWFDIYGDDDNFEFSFMFFWVIIVRFHFISEKNKKPTVQLINVLSHAEENCQIVVPDQQTEDESFHYLPLSYKSKFEQSKYFQKENNKISIRWLKIVGPNPRTMPFYIHVDSIEPNCSNEIIAMHSGFRTFATTFNATRK